MEGNIHQFCYCVSCPEKSPFDLLCCPHYHSHICLECLYAQPDELNWVRLNSELVACLPCIKTLFLKELPALKDNKRCHGCYTTRIIANSGIPEQDMKLQWPVQADWEKGEEQEEQEEQEEEEGEPSPPTPLKKKHKGQ